MLTATATVKSVGASVHVCGTKSEIHCVIQGSMHLFWHQIRIQFFLVIFSGKLVHFNGLLRKLNGLLRKPNGLLRKVQRISPETQGFLRFFAIY